MACPSTDPWRCEPLEGQLRLTAILPGANLAAVHAVARGRLGLLRGRMLAEGAVLRELAAAVSRSDAPGRDWAERQALLAAGQAELADIQADLIRADVTGELPGVPAGALPRWHALAAARLERLVPAVLALEEAHPSLCLSFEAARAARIAALSRKLVGQHGISWHRTPGAQDETLPPPLRAASMEASNGHGQRVTLQWRHDAANDMEWLRWQSFGGKMREDGSVAGRAAVLAALRPLALAA